MTKLYSALCHLAPALASFALLSGCAPAQPPAQAAAPPPEPCPCRDNPAPEPQCPEPIATAAPPPAQPAATGEPVPELEANSKIFKVGETAHQLDYELTVFGAKECPPRYYEVQSLNRAGHRLIAVEMLIESISDKPFTPGTYAMKVVDSEGLTYKYSFRGKCEPRLQSGSLNKGEKVRGWVTFEVNVKAQNLQFAYDHMSILGPKQNVKFDLGM